MSSSNPWDYLRLAQLLKGHPYHDPGAAQMRQFAGTLPTTIWAYKLHEAAVGDGTAQSFMFPA